MGVIVPAPKVVKWSRVRSARPGSGTSRPQSAVHDRADPHRTESGLVQCTARFKRIRGAFGCEGKRLKPHAGPHRGEAPVRGARHRAPGDTDLKRPAAPGGGASGACQPKKYRRRSARRDCASRSAGSSRRRRVARPRVSRAVAARVRRRPRHRAPSRQGALRHRRVHGARLQRGNAQAPLHPFAEHCRDRGHRGRLGLVAGRGRRRFPGRAARDCGRDSLERRLRPHTI